MKQCIPQFSNGGKGGMHVSKTTHATGFSRGFLACSRGYALKIKLFFPGEKEARMLLSAVSPEIGNKFERRSRTKMNINKNVLSLKIDALDLTALRASANSYLRFIALCSSLIS